MDRLISQTFEVGGALTDVTSAKLSDPTGTYGVKRNDTNAAVVADGTDMTRTTTGTYEYTLAAVANVAYTAYIEFVYDGDTFYVEFDMPAVGTGTCMLAAYPTLLEVVGRRFLGRRSGFNSTELSDLNEIICEGLRNVYRAHNWSFLRPTQNITTEADEDIYDLPSGFDGIDDNLLTWPEGEGYYAPVPIVPQGDIRRRLSQDDTTGRPLYASIIAAEYDETVGSKRQIQFYPIPDDEYTLTAVMRLRWTPIDETNLYPIGGEIVADAIKASCLAAGERFLDTEQGVYAEAFEIALAAAIRQDKEATSPPTLGCDGEPLDLSGRRLTRASYMGDVTFNDETM